MATYEEMLETFKKEARDIGFHIHEELYHAIVDHLGPSIHDRDASLVACSDKEELALVKKNFLIDKLGMEDGPELDKVIKEVCHALGESNRNKHRATFYYLLTGILKKESVFIEVSKVD